MNENRDIEKKPYWPEYYLELEGQYTAEVSSAFYNRTEGDGKERARGEVLRLREQFKRMWNLTHISKFEGLAG